MKPLLHSIVCCILPLMTIVTETVFAQSLQTEQSVPERPHGFTENKGQMVNRMGIPVPTALFKGEESGVTYWITETGLTFQTARIEPLSRAGFKLFWERFDVLLQGAHISREQMIAEEPVAGESSYFLPHCSDGIHGVRSYSRITVKEVYPGIDWVLYYRTTGGLKYDFVVHPGADPSHIQLIYRSRQPIRITDTGGLEINTHYGLVTEQAPISFSEGKKIQTVFTELKTTPIVMNEDAGFETTIGFEFRDPVNRTSDVIIDPDLVWGTFVSGDYSEGIRAMTSTPNNELYITGFSNSSDFPYVDPAGGAYFQDSLNEFEDLFIMKFSDTGELLWSTFYGGNSCDYPSQLLLDAQGDIFITGETNSFNFPTQNPGNNGFYQFQHGGNFYDGFILKFGSNGNRLWATYLGGENNDEANGLAIDSQGNIYIAGYTQSQAFPLQNPANGAYFQPGTASIGIADVFLCKFSNDGQMLWSTYYGGSGSETAKAIVVDANDNLFVTGTSTSANFPMHYVQGAHYNPNIGGDYTGFLLKFNSNGVRLWGTGFGGMFNEDIFALALDDENRLYVTGLTDSPDFPLLNPGNGAFFQDDLAGHADAFISRFSNGGTLQWSTYFGGSYQEGMMSQHPYRTYDKLDVDNCGNVTLVFETESHDLPTKKVDEHSFFRKNPSGGTSDIYIARFCDSGRLLWGTYFGGNGFDSQPSLEVDRSGNLYVSCYTGGSTVAASTYPLLDPGSTTFYSTNHSYMAASLLTKFNTNTGSLYVDSVTPVSCTEPGNIDMHIRGLCYPLSFTWSNGEETLNTTNESNSVGNLEEGTYTITVTGECGQLSETIEVGYFCPPVVPPVAEELSFPNILTPNGDQLNDVFVPITASGITDYELIIVNRWGQEVFRSMSIPDGWNGNTAGESCLEGVYFWKVQFTTISGTEGESDGNVTLIR